jgi:hypothetical protein
LSSMLPMLFLRPGDRPPERRRDAGASVTPSSFDALSVIFGDLNDIRQKQTNTFFPSRHVSYVSGSAGAAATRGESLRPEVMLVDKLVGMVADIF